MKLVIKRTNSKLEKKEVIPICKKFRSKSKKDCCGERIEFEDKKHIVTIPLGKFRLDCPDCEYSCPVSNCDILVPIGKNKKPIYACPKCSKN